MHGGWDSGSDRAFRGTVREGSQLLGVVEGRVVNCVTMVTVEDAETELCLKPVPGLPVA